MSLMNMSILLASSLTLLSEPRRSPCGDHAEDAFYLVDLARVCRRQVHLPA